MQDEHIQDSPGVIRHDRFIPLIVLFLNLLVIQTPSYIFFSFLACGSKMLSVTNKNLLVTAVDDLYYINDTDRSIKGKSLL